jgi:hypothetical protein
MAAEVCGELEAATQLRLRLRKLAQVDHDRCEAKVALGDEGYVVHLLGECDARAEIVDCVFVLTLEIGDECGEDVRDLGQEIGVAGLACERVRHVEPPMRLGRAALALVYIAEQ